jgi:hypothetical protein
VDSIRQLYSGCDTIICSSISYQITKSTPTPIFNDVVFVDGDINFLAHFYNDDEFYDFPNLVKCKRLAIQGYQNRIDPTRQYLQKITAFPKLVEVDAIGIFLRADLIIPSNQALSLEGFNNLRKVNNIFTLHYCGRKLNSFSKLEEVGNRLIISNTLLENLDEFSSLRRIGKTFGSVNPSELTIARNPRLKNIDGLRDVVLAPNYYGTLVIARNDSLTICNNKSICDIIAIGKQIIEIFDNGVGCESVEVIKQQCISNIQNYNDTKLKLSPNPSTGWINIVDYGEAVTISVHDLSGKQILFFKEVTKQVDITNLPSGMYIFDIRNKEISERHKIVKVE